MIMISKQENGAFNIHLWVQIKFGKMFYFNGDVILNDDNVKFIYQLLK